MRLLPKIVILLNLLIIPSVVAIFIPKLIIFVPMLVLILVIAIIIYLNKIIFKPLNLVLQATTQLIMGKFQSINHHSNDEIGEIIHEFNELNVKLQTLTQSTKSINNEVLAEKNKLNVALSAITDGVIALDLNHDIVLFNQAAAKILGYEAAEVIDKPFEQLVKIRLKDKEIPFNFYCPVKPGFEGVIFNQTALDLFGKKPATVNMTTCQLKPGSSVNISCIITLHDVTKERDLERMKVDFVSMAAHELRTPLTSMRGYLDVIYKESPPKGEYFQFLEKAIIGTNELFTLITNLLDVSKVERGAMNINFLPTNLLEITKRVVSNLLTTASNKQVELKFTEPISQIPNIPGDKIRLEEVITNLIANAINYTNPGGKITVWLDSDNSSVSCHVQDTGKGIPKEAIPHLFTKFFRVGTILEAQASKGTGLGLYISKSIIDLHKGKIWVNSEVGKGSTFSFSIPMKKE